MPTLNPSQLNIHPDFALHKSIQNTFFESLNLRVHQEQNIFQFRI